MSPEMVMGEDKYSFPTDIWSLGCILYEVCALKKAFQVEDGNQMQLMTMVTSGPIPDLPDKYSDDLKAIYSEMMNRTPDERPRIFDILKKPMLNDIAKRLLDSKLYSAEFD